MDDPEWGGGSRMLCLGAGHLTKFDKGGNFRSGSRRVWSPISLLSSEIEEKMSSDYLFKACKEGDVATVRQAVADGVDVRKVVDKRWLHLTPLHCACQYVDHFCL